MKRYTLTQDQRDTLVQLIDIAHYLTQEPDPGIYVVANHLGALSKATDVCSTIDMARALEAPKIVGLTSDAELAKAERKRR